MGSNLKKKREKGKKEQPEEELRFLTITRTPVITVTNPYFSTNRGRSSSPYPFSLPSSPLQLLASDCCWAERLLSRVTSRLLLPSPFPWFLILALRGKKFLWEISAAGLGGLINISPAHCFASVLWEAAQESRRGIKSISWPFYYRQDKANILLSFFFSVMLLSHHPSSRRNWKATVRQTAGL